MRSNTKPEDEKSNVISIVGRKSQDSESGYDPLEDPVVLEFMKEFYQLGIPSVFSSKGSRGSQETELQQRREAIISQLSHQDTCELGLNAPVMLIRAPTSKHTGISEGIRHIFGGGGYRAQHMIVAGWLYERRIDRDLIHKYTFFLDRAPHEGRDFRGETLSFDNISELDMLLHSLEDYGFIRTASNGAIVPTRVFLYRALESCMWLVDSIAPWVYNYTRPDFADKVDYWPPIDKGIK